MLATVSNDLTVIAAILIVIGCICTPVRQDKFQQGLGATCLILGILIIIGCAVFPTNGFVKSDQTSTKPTPKR